MQRSDKIDKENKCIKSNNRKSKKEVELNQKSDNDKIIKRKVEYKRDGKIFNKYLDMMYNYTNYCKGKWMYRYI